MLSDPQLPASASKPQESGGDCGKTQTRFSPKEAKVTGFVPLFAVLELEGLGCQTFPVAARNPGAGLTCICSEFSLISLLLCHPRNALDLAEP